MMDLDNMQLPKSNEQEELEELSKDKLKPLFDLKLFQIREETYRDKGIDLDIELKYNNCYTNFRFIVQLKATNTIEENSDGSYSKPIDTSNIQYLFNSSKQAYYIFYHKPSESFYYININTFIKKISDKNKNWESQKTNTLRLEKKLTSQVIQNIYDNVLERGKNLRKINQILALSSTNNFDKISLTDENLSFYSEGEIRDKLEEFGLSLINEGNSKLVVKSANLVSKNLQRGFPKFNLVTAVANYNLGNMLESLSFLKDAERDKNKLNKEDQSLLNFFVAKVKYSLGLLTNEEYYTKLTAIEESNFIQYYVKIESLEKKYNNNENVVEYSLEKYKKDLDKIINEEDVPENVVNLAKVEFYKYWTLDMNLKGLRNSMLVNRSIGSAGVINSIESQKKQIDEIDFYFEETQKKIVKDKDIFNYWLLESYRINYWYESFLISKVISNTEGKLQSNETEIFNSVKLLIVEIRKIRSKYDAIGHVENKIVCMAQEYEMLLFLEETTKASGLKDEIDSIINLYELKDFKRRFKLLNDGDTKFFRLSEFLKDSNKDYDDNVKKVKGYMDKVSEFDKKDKKRQEILDGNIYTIDLFPLGHFSFKQNKLMELYDVLRIDDNRLIKQLERMFSFVIPQLNLFKEKITEEGHLNGVLEYEGLNSWALVYERRKKLYENKIIKVDLFSE